MANYNVSDSSLISIANAIRAKGETNLPLEYPDDFVTAIQNISSSGGLSVDSLSVTQNGTYNAASNKVWNQVIVNTPIVTGTFTATTASEIKTISIPYTGTGYPISINIYPTGGAYKNGTTAYTSTQKKAMLIYSFTKSNDTAPDFGNDAEKNQGVVFAWYKNSDSDGTNLTTSVGKTTRTFTTQNPVGSYSINAVKFSDATTMKVYIAGTDEYGFLPNIEYTYQIVYSSQEVS